MSMVKNYGFGAVLLSSTFFLAACNDSDNDNNKAASSAASSLVVAPVQLTLRVMETSDLHANVMNYNYYQNRQDDSVGLVKTATLIQQARDAVDNSVLVDNGDLIQGSPLGDYFAKVGGLSTGEVHPIFKAMNQLDYDVANIGNHEFNYGLSFLNEALDDANFPYISSNVFIDDGDDNTNNDEPYFLPYLLQEKTVIDQMGASHTLRIGYLGFVPPQIMQWDQANLTGKVIAKDIVAMAERYVPELQAQGADIIVAIAHSGLVTTTATGLDENASYYLAGVDGIDAIMFGHAHRNFPGDAGYEGLEGVDNTKGTIQGVAAVMPGYWGKHLGYIDLSLEYTAPAGWRVVDSQSVLLPISTTNEDRSITSLVNSHSGIVEAVADDHAIVADWVSQPFAKISAPINSFFALVQDDPSIQVVTDAQKWYVENIVQGTDYDGLPILSVGAPFRAGRGGPADYTNLAAGDVAYGNVADLYIYPNTLKVLMLSGAEVKEWLEMSAGQFNTLTIGGTDQPLINDNFPSYNFDVIDGVTYQLDLSVPAKYSVAGELANADSQRIKNLHYQGQPVADEQIFLVVSNNYRASGGGNFPDVTADKIVINAPDENRQAVADYLVVKTQQNPESGFDPSADKNWRFVALPGTSALFWGSASDAARSFAAANTTIEYLSQNDDGFGVYRIHFDN